MSDCEFVPKACNNKFVIVKSCASILYNMLFGFDIFSIRMINHGKQDLMQAV